MTDARASLAPAFGLGLGIAAVAVRVEPVVAHGALGHGLGHGWVVTIIEVALVAAFALFAAYSLYHRHK